MRGGALRRKRALSHEKSFLNVNRNSECGEPAQGNPIPSFEPSQRLVREKRNSLQTQEPPKLPMALAAKLIASASRATLKMKESRP